MSISRSAFKHVVLVIPVFVVASWATAGGEDFEPDRAVIRLALGANIADIHQQFGTLTVDVVAGRSVFLLDLPDGVSEENFAAELAADPRVIWADVNYIARDPGPGTQSFYLARTFMDYQNQYPRTLTRLPEAHQIASGIGIRIAVLDNGIDASHPQFAGAILPGGYNFVHNSTDVSDSAAGIDSDQDGLFDEMLGHGTFVSGLIRMTAPGAGILPVKVLDSNGWTTTFRVAEGIDFAVSSGVHVINLSLGSPGDGTVWSEAISWAEQAGVIVVAASGNDGNEQPGWNPARVPDVVAVASTDSFDTRSPFSNYGVYIDLCAPGSDIVSTLPGGGYGFASGTSAATPMVAGVVALMQEARPGLNAAQYRQILIEATDSVVAQNPGFEGLLGNGRLNAQRAVLRLCPADFNHDRVVNTGDFFDFLAAFYEVSPRADFNSDGLITSQDFFDFLTEFVQGCPV